MVSETAYTCPFCGSSSFSRQDWQIPNDDDEQGFAEVDALECTNCFAGAPIAAWEAMTNHEDAA